jgi:hypothetical protein
MSVSRRRRILTALPGFACREFAVADCGQGEPVQDGFQTPQPPGGVRFGISQSKDAGGNCLFDRRSSQNGFLDTVPKIETLSVGSAVFESRGISVRFQYLRRQSARGASWPGSLARRVPPLKGCDRKLLSGSVRCGVRSAPQHRVDLIARWTGRPGSGICRNRNHPGEKTFTRQR